MWPACTLSIYEMLPQDVPWWAAMVDARGSCWSRTGLWASVGCVVVPVASEDYRLVAGTPASGCGSDKSTGDDPQPATTKTHVCIIRWVPVFQHQGPIIVQQSLLRKKASIHQETTMLATSKNVQFPGHNHLLTIGTSDQLLQLSPKRQLPGG